MVTRQERLIEVLTELGGSAGNGRLREALGWQQDTYDRAREALLADGKIVKGRGRGGSVALAGMSAPERSMASPAAALPSEPKRRGRRGDGQAAPPTNGGGANFAQVFRSIDDVLRREAKQTTELDYTEQTSWMLFLKYLDDLEAERADEADLRGKDYHPILDDEHRWGAWAKDLDLTGDDLIEWVNGDLWPYLRGFKARATGPQTLEYKIGEIFGEIEPKFQSGYSLRDALERVDQLRFRSQAERHELSALYEDKIRRMGNAGRNGGEYYTPRPLIRAMIQVVDPRIGERVYDGACGSAGFLCEAFDHMRAKARSTADLDTLQTRTLLGREKKPLAYVIGVMNMILHGVEAPDIRHENTLLIEPTNIPAKDRFEVVLANPPFGGSERKEVSDPYPIRTGETAYLFLQHFMRSLKVDLPGRAAVVIKNTFLSNTDQASVALRRELLEDYDLHTVLDMPQGTFQGAGVKTVVLFFERGRRTEQTWYYKLDPGRSLGKTNPLNDADMADFLDKQPGRKDSPCSWTVARDTVNGTTYDLSVRNPNVATEAEARTPEAILAEIGALDAETARALERVRALL
ncbi:MAG TPA: N-6 DNA methylase [Caulobacteraceae bacterium]|jgi:type I restriction enzyme M protein